MEFQPNMLQQKLYSWKRVFLFSIFIVFLTPLPFLHCFDGCSWALWPALLPGLHLVVFPITVGLVIGYSLLLFCLIKKFIAKKYFFGIFTAILFIVPFLNDFIIVLMGGKWLWSASIFMKIIFLIGADTIRYSLLPDDILALWIILVTYLLYLVYIMGVVWTASVISKISADIQLFRYYRFAIIFIGIIFIGIQIFELGFAKTIVSNRLYNVNNIDDCFKSEITNISSDNIPPPRDLKGAGYLPYGASSACGVVYAVKHQNAYLCKKATDHAGGLTNQYNFDKCIRIYNLNYPDDQLCERYFSEFKGKAIDPVSKSNLYDECTKTIFD